MQSAATTPEQYLAELPEDRRALVSALRQVVNANRPAGTVEGMQYGMLGWSVSREVFPAGYHCNPAQGVPYVSLANQKGGVSLYLFCIYVDAGLAAWFEQAWRETGKRLDMGKGCVRFKRLEDVPLELIGETLRRMPLQDFLATYQAGIPASKKKPGRG